MPNRYVYQLPSNPYYLEKYRSEVGPSHLSKYLPSQYEYMARMPPPVQPLLTTSGHDASGVRWPGRFSLLRLPMITSEPFFFLSSCGPRQQNGPDCKLNPALSGGRRRTTRRPNSESSRPRWPCNGPARAFFVFYNCGLRHSMAGWAAETNAASWRARVSVASRRRWNTATNWSTGDARRRSRPDALGPSRSLWFYTGRRSLRITSASEDSTASDGS